MPRWLHPTDHAIVAAAAERLVPGAGAAAVADYIDGLLGAFTSDPPRIWAGGPFSGRARGDRGRRGDGGYRDEGGFLPLGAVEELAWRTRIEGSLGIPEREFNGPVTGLQEYYRAGIQALGDDFASLDGPEQDERLDAVPEFKRLLYRHACEGMYGDPAYGGNRDGHGWAAIGFAGDTQPRGWTDVEVTRPRAGDD